MSNESVIRKKIDELREGLYKVLKEADGISTEEVLELSKELDEVLNKYYKLIKSENM